MTPQRGRPPRLDDVARVAGVSHQTVSRVVNGLPNVSAATQARVEEAIEQLGYRRNRAARELVTGRSNVIGLLTPWTHHFGPAGSMLAAETAARKAGYAVSVRSAEDASQDSMDDAVEHFLSLGVEAVVMIAPEREWLVAAEQISTTVPVVLMNADVATPGERLGSVAMDNTAAGRRVAAYLAELGHRDVTHIAGPLDSYEAAGRQRGWESGLQVRGLPRRPVLHGDWTAAGGAAAATQLIEAGLPTAVFAANDQMALGLMWALGQAGVSVPGDVSVVGFDDVPEAPFYGPGLTTIRQDFATLGTECIDILEQMLAGGAAKAVNVRPELVVRASTGPPASRPTSA